MCERAYAPRAHSALSIRTATDADVSSPMRRTAQGGGTARSLRSVNAATVCDAALACIQERVLSE